MKTIENYSYKVSQHIGKGYSSTVHKGVNDKTGEEISIKVIEMVKLEDPINQMLLQYEVAALKNLTFSSNVLHFYDVYATKNNTYIITQLCQGDLGSLLKQRKQFPYFQAVQILKQLVLGYNDIHKIGFLHRDIKPANIFYRKGIYKIGDFGFSIPISQINQHKDYNVGSPVYMPPQALKSNIYNVSSDTWAIGIIFFQLIKGLVPWRAISEKKLHQKIMTQPLNALTNGLPQVARTFLADVLNLDPIKRMTPSQMINWISKLSAVQIRSLSPYQVRRQNPLQQIKIVPHCQRGQIVLNHLNSNQIHSNLHINQKHHVYSVPNIVSLDQRKELQNVNSNNTPKMNKVNFFPKNQNQQTGGFYAKQPKIVSETKDFKQAQNFAESFINYLKFVHRVLKFIGAPTKLVFEQLEQSTIRHLFKQFQRIKKVKESENCFQLKIQEWSQFIKSQKGHHFNKKLQKYETKYGMFHVLSSEYPPQVYKQQICSGILKISAYLQDKQTNFSQKLVIALDYLITFYQLIQLKNRLELKQFLKVSKINQIINGNPYNVNKQHLPQLKKRMQILGILEENQQTKNMPKVINNYQESYNFNFYPNQINNGEVSLKN